MGSLEMCVNKTIHRLLLVAVRRWRANNKIRSNRTAQPNGLANTKINNVNFAKADVRITQTLVATVARRWIETRVSEQWIQVLLHWPAVLAF